jgi:hypothetical protein
MTAPTIFSREMEALAEDSWQLRLGPWRAEVWVGTEGHVWGDLWFVGGPEVHLLHEAPSSSSPAEATAAIESWLRATLAETVGALGLEPREVGS